MDKNPLWHEAKRMEREAIAENKNRIAAALEEQVQSGQAELEAMVMPGRAVVVRLEVRVEGRTWYGVGVALYHPADKHFAFQYLETMGKEGETPERKRMYEAFRWNEEKGRKIALGRAVHDIAVQMHKASFKQFLKDLTVERNTPDHVKERRAIAEAKRRRIEKRTHINEERRLAARPRQARIEAKVEAAEAAPLAV